MPGETKIQWTDATWNPVRGCSRISPGCEHCYAETMAGRFCGDGRPFHGYATLTAIGGRWTRKVSLIPEMLDLPLHWKKPRRIFVNSMSDLFHEALPFEHIEHVFAVMANCPQHSFQVLTKRAARMREFFERVAPFGQNVRATSFLAGRNDVYRWPLPNVWLGVSVEDQERADERIPELLAIPAAVRFLSVEPMLGPITFTEQTLRGHFLGCKDETDDPATDECNGCPGYTNRGGDYCGAVRGPHVDWVIVGGESGHCARPFDIAWARSIVAQCKAAGVACFVKQMGELPVMDEAAWRAGPMTPLLSAKNDKRTPPGLVPLACGGHKGGDPLWWPADLRVREFPEARP